MRSGNWPNFSMQRFHMLRVPDEIGATPPFVKYFTGRKLLGSLNRFSALMESATLWKVDATETALRAEPGLDRFP
jgi:hypothetical protein